MVNLKHTMMGLTLFLSGYVGMVITYNVVPLLIDTLVDVATSFGGWEDIAILSQISWAGLIIAWIATVLIGPPLLVVYGLKQETPAEVTNFGLAFVGAIMFVIGIIFTYIGYYMVPILDSFLDILFMRIIFWVGLISTWVLAIIVTPVFCVIEGTKH